MYDSNVLPLVPLIQENSGKMSGESCLLHNMFVQINLSMVFFGPDILFWAFNIILLIRLWPSFDMLFLKLHVYHFILKLFPKDQYPCKGCGILISVIVQP